MHQTYTRRQLKRAGYPVTGLLETELAAAEFIVLPIFGRDRQPEYQIEIHLGGSQTLTLAELDTALTHAQTPLSHAVA